MFDLGDGDPRFENSDILQVLQEAGGFKGMDLDNPELPKQQTLGEAMEADRALVQEQIDGTPPPLPEPAVPPAEPQAPAPVAEPAIPAEPAATPVPQGATIPEYEIPPEDLDKYYTMGNVYGEERKFTLKDLTNIGQTQEAASKQLEDYKALVKDFAHTQQPAPFPQEVPEPEYMTDEERALSQMETKVNRLESSLRQTETNRMTEAENAHVIASLAEAGMTQEDFGHRVNHLLTENPNLAPYAKEVFTEVPKTREDQAKRQGMFDLLLRTTKAMDNPSVVRTTRDQAFREGQVAAKVEAKRNLTNVETGVSQPSEPTRADMIAKASKLDNDDAWTELVLKTGMFKE